MKKKPLAAVLALLVLVVAGLVIYNQMNRTREVIDMFDKPAEASYNKIIEWSNKYNSVAAAKSKSNTVFMVPTETQGSELKTVYVRKGTPALTKSYILVYDRFRIEAISGTSMSSAMQAQGEVQAAISQFSDQYKEVQVHGKAGLSAAASDTTVNGIQYKIPTSVAWSENGTTYLAIAKDMSVDDLLEICESTKPNN
jgi:hypothetical protein